MKVELGYTTPIPQSPATTCVFVNAGIDYGTGILTGQFVNVDVTGKIVSSKNFSIQLSAGVGVAALAVNLETILKTEIDPDTGLPWLESTTPPVVTP